MSSVDYINALAARGIQLWAQDGKLQYKAPKEALTPQLLAELKEHKATLINLLEQFAGTAGSYPLSYSQKSLWSLHQINPGSAAYNVTYAARLCDAPDLQALARCVDYLIARHPILRTRYAVVDGQPQQQVSAEPSARLVIDKAFDADEAAILAWVDNEANKPFDLSVSPIRMRLLVNALSDPASAAPAHVLLLNVHHVAADFWSLEIIVRELQALYPLALAQQPLRLPPLTVHYKDCVQHESQRLQGVEGKALAGFWENELQAVPPPLNLATDHLRPPVKTENGRVHSLPLGEAMSRSVKEAARTLHVTPYMLLLSVYQLFLSLHSGQSKLFIGAPTSGRSMPGSEHVLGHFVNTVVLACELRSDDSFADLLVRTRHTMLRVMDHQDYPFPLLVEKMRPPRDPSRSPVFQVMYNWNQLRSNEPQLAGSGQPPLIGQMLAASSTGTRGATHDLTLNVQDYGSEYLAAWTYNTDLFDAETIERFAQQFRGLVAQVLADATQGLPNYRLAADATRAQVLDRIAHAARAFEGGSPLPAACVERARRHADETVWQLPGQLLRRGEVAEAVTALRAQLQAHGVGAGSVVGLALASAPELAVALVAALSLDASVQLIAANDPAWSGVLVTGSSSAWCAWAPALIEVRQSASDVAAAPAPVSTAHIGGFIEGVGQLFDIGETSRPVLLEGTEPRLAAAVMVMTLACGGTVCVPGDVSVASIAHAEAEVAAAAERALDAAIEQHQASALAMAALLLPTISPAVLARLSSLVVYGEHPHALEQLSRQAAGRTLPTALHFIPAFCLEAWQGPVAFAPDAGRWRLVPLKSAYPLPLVLSPSTDLADDHQAGRLHLLMPGRPGPIDAQPSAAQLGQHADLAPVLSAHHLVETPLAVTQRHGRIVSASPSRRVASHRGASFAIAPVEAVIALQAGVREVVCVLQAAAEAADSAQAPVFTACLSLDEGHNAAEFEAELRRSLKRVLPEGMHPEAYVVVDRLPLSPEGSIDLQRLPRAQAHAHVNRSASSEVERVLASIWCEVMSLPSVGVDDDFFQLGGDSILAAVIVSRAGLEGLYLKPKDVFEHTTIASLARVVSTVPQIQAEQGALTGEVAMGPAAAWFFDKVGIDRSHFNQALLLSLHQVPDAAVMQETLRQIAQQHDVLRSRFVQRDGQWRQVFEAADPVADWASVSCVGSDGHTSADLWHQAIASAQTGLDIERGPLWRVRWLVGATLAESRLLIVVHHLLIDGLSWNTLLQDVSDVYMRLRAGGAAQLPLKTSSTKAWVEQWTARAAGDAMADDRRYWQGFAEQLQRRLSGGQAVALMRCGTAPATHKPRVTPAGSCAISLDVELSTAFRTTAHQAYGTDANDLLVAALHAGFQAWGGSQALLLDLEGHGRDALTEVVDLSRSLGWFTSIYPVLIEGPGLHDPAQLIKQVKQTLREIPGKGAGFGVLRYLGAADSPVQQALAALPPSPVLFTYLGQLDQIVASTGLYTGAVQPAAGIRSPRQHQTHLLDVCAYVSEGRLTIECAFDSVAAVEDSIGCLMQRVEHALTTIVRHCCSDEAGGLTPSDVPDIDIDQEGLDALLEEVAALAQ